MPVRAGVAPVVDELRGEDSAVWLPASSGSLGIWTLSLGRTSLVAMLFVREGGRIVGIEEVDCVRWGAGGGTCAADGSGGEWPFAWRRDIAATSIDWERTPVSILTAATWLRGVSSLVPQPPIIERLSSMGVKMLCLAAEDRGLG